MKDGPALLIVGILIIGRTTFALFSGSAGIDNKSFLREDRPIVYRVSIVGGYVAAIGVFVAAILRWNVN